MRKAALSPLCPCHSLHRRPGLNKIPDLYLRHRAQFALWGAEVEVGNNLLICAQPQTGSDLRVVSHITGTPDRTNTLRMGSQKNAMGGAAGGQHLLLRWHFQAEEHTSELQSQSNLISPLL